METPFLVELIGFFGEGKSKEGLPGGLDFWALDPGKAPLFQSHCLGLRNRIGEAVIKGFGPLNSRARWRINS
jgi:hypothetical protein